MVTKKDSKKLLCQSVSFFGKPKIKKTVINKYVNVTLGSSIYDVNTVSTRNPSVVISWFKNNVLGRSECSVPLCVIQNRGDFILGFWRNNKALLYQLSGLQRIPLSIVNLIKDETRIQFLGYKISQNLAGVLTGLGFDAKIFNGSPKNNDLEEEFNSIEKLVSTTKRNYEVQVEGALIQEETILLSCLHLLRAYLL
ncbi:hypothetical protein MKW92_037845, partial [Papaver armeniacum]